MSLTPNVPEPRPGNPGSSNQTAAEKGSRPFNEESLTPDKNDSFRFYLDLADAAQLLEKDNPDAVLTRLKPWQGSSVLKHEAEFAMRMHYHELVARAAMRIKDCGLAEGELLKGLHDCKGQRDLETAMGYRAGFLLNLAEIYRAADKLGLVLSCADQAKQVAAEIAQSSAGATARFANSTSSPWFIEAIASMIKGDAFLEMDEQYLAAREYAAVVELLQDKDGRAVDTLVGAAYKLAWLKLYNQEYLTAGAALERIFACHAVHGRVSKVTLIMSHCAMSVAAVMSGRFKRAIAECEKFVEQVAEAGDFLTTDFSKDEVTVRVSSASARAALGDWVGAQLELSCALETGKRHDQESQWQISSRLQMICEHLEAVELKQESSRVRDLLKYLS